MTNDRRREEAENILLVALDDSIGQSAKWPVNHAGEVSPWLRNTNSYLSKSAKAWLLLLRVEQFVEPTCGAIDGPSTVAAARV